MYSLANFLFLRIIIKLNFQIFFFITKSPTNFRIFWDSIECSHQNYWNDCSMGLSFARLNYLVIINAVVVQTYYLLSNLGLFIILLLDFKFNLIIITSFSIAHSYFKNFTYFKLIFNLLIIIYQFDILVMIIVNF